LLAAFASEEDAVAAGLALVEAFRSADLDQHVRLAIHAGRCIAVHRVGRVAYFGSTLLRGGALLLEAPQGGLAVSGEVADQPRPLSLLYQALVDHPGLRGALATSETEPYAGR